MLRQMNIDFDNLFQHVIPMDDFRLKWRFTKEKYDLLPKQHLDQLKPLDKEAAKFLWDYIAKTNLHNDIPFNLDYAIGIYYESKSLQNSHFFFFTIATLCLSRKSACFIGLSPLTTIPIA